MTYIRRTNNSVLTVASLGVSRRALVEDVQMTRVRGEIQKRGPEETSEQPHEENLKNRASDCKLQAILYVSQ